MKKVILIGFLGLLLLGPSKEARGQSNVLIASDHAYPVKVGMDVAKLRWIVGYSGENPCAGKVEGCSLDISQVIAGGKAKVILQINEKGIIENIVVTQ